MRRPGPVAASLPLQMLIYYNYWIILIYTIITIIGFVYKGEALPYPSNLLGWEIVAFIMFLVIDLCRLYIGSKGNRTRNVITTGTFLLLTLPIIIGNIFFTQWQTFILRIDLIIHYTDLVFNCLEFLLGIFAILGFTSTYY